MSLKIKGGNEEAHYISSFPQTTFLHSFDGFSFYHFRHSSKMSTTRTLVSIFGKRIFWSQRSSRGFFPVTSRTSKNYSSLSSSVTLSTFPSTTSTRRQQTLTYLPATKWPPSARFLWTSQSDKTKVRSSSTSTNQVEPAEEDDNQGTTNVGGDSQMQKKRAKRKTTGGRFITDEQGLLYDTKNTFPVMAYATCEELDLEKLHEGLVAQDLYEPSILSEDMEDVIHVTAKYKISNENREIFFFREGAVVFWNMPEQECMNALKFLRRYEHSAYDSEQVKQELEFMRYGWNDLGPTRLSRGRIMLNVESENKILEKYAFANALSSSVKLGIWESTLDNFVESIAHITEELKQSTNVKLSRKEVLQKTGELFSLRHELNLNSDLLDTPDFYWERERLETLYRTTCNYLNIDRRTKVLNEKLAQCCELLELVSTHLTDTHHTRLEWMIIALITIEVGFEILHVVERYC